MVQFRTVATGGTFDLLHRGHLELLARAFSVSSRVIIGLTSDDFAARLGKTTFHNYIQRFQNLSALIGERFPDGEFQISQLDDYFGPAALEAQVEALITSEGTAAQGRTLTDRRKERGIGPVRIVIVPMVLAGDGRRISSTRLKNSEIDFDGNMN